MKLWQIPSGGLKYDKNDYLQEFTNHSNKVIITKWHPTADNTLASASTDSTVKVWDVSRSQNEIFSLNVNDYAYDLEWNYDGSLIGCITKEKMLNIGDPRAGDDKV